MRLQVLLSAINQKDHSILKRSNIQTEAIVINQADCYKKEEFYYRGRKIFFLTFAERGIGLSRNNALMRSSADIVLFADDDVEYVDHYEKIILSEFKKNPKADMLVFNVPSRNSSRPTSIIKSEHRVHKYNCLRYGAVKMAVRLDKLRRNNLYFSLLFGGGAKYSSGEDSIFIYSAIRSGMRVYACPKIIGYVSQTSSTWFNGYTDKYFIDKGALYKQLFKKLAPIMVLQYALRKRRIYSEQMSTLQAIRLMLKGIKQV